MVSADASADEEAVAAVKLVLSSDTMIYMDLLALDEHTSKL